MAEAIIKTSLSEGESIMVDLNEKDQEIEIKTGSNAETK